MEREREEAEVVNGWTPSEAPAEALEHGSGADVRLVVGLGASAGGLEALEAFFSGLPEAGGIAFAVILHLPPDEESRLADILQRTTPLPTTQVTEAARVEAGHVYVIPPGKNLLVEDGALRLEPIEEERLRRAPVDHFFRTLAEAYGRRAVGVILSGTGSNGSVGAQRIKERGGLVIAQAPEEAAFDEMPRSALQAGTADLALPVREIGTKLVAYRDRLGRAPLPETEAEAEAALSGDGARAVQGILALLRTRTGHDFAHYKRSTVLRRLARRLHVVGAADYAAYLERLRTDASEPQALLADLLISVTSFFRDGAAFEALGAGVVPKLFEGKGFQDDVRVWVAGCATGEEAYSIAMLLLEHAAGLAEPPAVQVFATDLNEGAIRAARAGRYPTSIEADVSAERLRRFFTEEGGGYRVRQDLRERVLFAPHSLLKDPPFSRLDLFSCRNLLIYLQPELQRQVVELAHYALRPGGYLFLGASESTDGAAGLYRSVDKPARLYRRRDVEAPVPRLPQSPRLETLTALATASERALERASAPPRPEAPGYAELHRRLQAEVAPPSVLVTEGLDVVHLSEGAAPYLYVAGGVPTRSLLKLARPELRLELQAALFQARRQGGAAETGAMRVEVEGQARRVQVRVRPVEEGELFQVVFAELPAELPIPEGDGANGAEGRAGEEEARHLRERLQLIVEEYETGREELKAQNEELQSINEELRLTVEELETSREEAQSVAEELRTVNDELGRSAEEAARARGDLENLMASTEIATLFLDRRLCIKRFTPRAREHFHLLASDVGRPLADLALALGHGRLLGDAKAVLETLEVREREIQSEGGRWHLTHVRPYRTVDDRIDGVVVTLVDVTASKRNEEALRESEARLRQALAAADLGTWTYDVATGATRVDERFRAIFGLAGEAVTSEEVMGLIHPDDLDPFQRAREAALDPASPDTFEGVHRIVRPDGAVRWLEGHARVRFEGGGEARRPVQAVGVVMDITERKEAEEALRESEERFRRMAETVPDVLFTTTPEGELEYASGRIETYTGRPPEAVRGTMVWPEIIHPDDRERTEARWAEAREERKPFEVRHRLRLRGGDVYRWAITRARPITDEAGRLLRWFGTITDVDELARTEEAVQALNRTLEERVEERTAQVRKLSAQLTVAEQEERQRIALILHDDLQQLLFGLSLTLSRLGPAPSEEEDALRQRADDLLGQATDLTRSLATELSPPVLGTPALLVLLQWMAHREKRLHDLDVVLDVRGACRVEDPNLRTLLYQILRELLFNVVKHAGVGRVEVTAWEDGSELTIRIEDEGSGFDIAAAAERKAEEGGFGLFSVRERVELVGGRFEIDSTPGDGTRVTVAVRTGGD